MNFEKRRLKPIFEKNGWAVTLEDGTKGVIGPHKDCTVELMFSGKKPVCSLDGEESDIEIQTLIKAAEAGRFHMHKRELGDAEETRFGIFTEFYFCQPDKLEDMQKLIALKSAAQSGEIPYDAQYHTTFGRLVGYSENDIKAFLATQGMTMPLDISADGPS